MKIFDITTILDTLFEDDMDFYERFILPLSEQEQKIFFQHCPEFLSNYGIDISQSHLLFEKDFRSKLRKYRA